MRTSVGAVLSFVLLVSACTGGDATEGSSPDIGSTSTTVAATSTTSTMPLSTMPPSTTTTTEAPQPVPIGVRWSGPVDVTVVEGSGSDIDGMVRLGDELWLFGGASNTSYLQRSDDAGRTWEIVDLQAPPESGAYSLIDLARHSSGTYLALGYDGSRCQRFQLDDGTLVTGICRRFRPVVHVSDDGETWRRIDPGVFAPPGGTTLMPESVVATDEGFVMAATVRGPDWHVRLFSSPDGEAWSLDREIRGDHALSARAILADDGVLVLVADEHPCPNINDNTPGWILGAKWPSHGRIYQGTSVGDLTLLGPEEHPFAVEPLDVDCSATSGFDLASVRYPRFIAQAGQVITLLETGGEPVPDDADPETGGVRRWAQLVDGEWVTVTANGVPVMAPAHRSYSPGLDVDGMPGVLEWETSGSVQVISRLLVPTEAGYEVRTAERGLIGQFIRAGVWIDDTFVLAGTSRTQPFNNRLGGDNYPRLQVWRSEAAIGPLVDTCVLGPGADCRFVDLSTLDGYPDFSGTDLRGIDFTLADLGDANFDGADLSGARLWDADTSGGFTARGTNFDGSQIGASSIRDVRDSSFVGAVLHGADLDDATGADFTNADLRRTYVGFSVLPTLDGAVLDGTILEPIYSEPYELDLAGLELAGATIASSFEADQAGVLLVITDVDGANLEGGAFRGSDLSRLDPEDLDLATIDVWEDSICPDGEPPDDPPIGTCERNP